MFEKKEGDEYWFSNLGTVILVLLVVLLGYMYLDSQKNLDKPGSLLGFQSLIVLSGSMEPALKAGDVIVVKKTAPELIKEGDIITFQVAGDVLVTHRVQEIISSAGGVGFKTKGDANRIEDGSLIEEQQLLGRVFLRIPFGGYMVNLVRSKWGFVLLLIVPVFILIYGEAKKVFTFKIK